MTRRPQENLELIRRVLGDDYLELSIEKLTIEEDLAAERAKVHLETVTTGNKRSIVVDGEGVGFIDALVHGLLQRFAQEYKSLESIELANFSVNADIDTTKSGQAGSDAVGEVTVEVRNSEHKLFRFSDSSRSVIASAARAVLAAVEYFVNAERAFIILHKAREDAARRNRTDLVARYTRELSEVVVSTSFAEVIEKIRKDLEPKS
ncbi:MAG: hypothetical protein HY791_23320 [Deltaproteobacteria bacterium]|nr:hypothetical protein [Deltaproteobacteria bacterium]